jgi:hypothetical protein
MNWFELGVVFAVTGAMGASAGFRWSIKQMDAAVQSITESARAVGLCSQRLVAEAALLKFDSISKAMDLPDDLAHGLNYPYLEED